jgi:tetratricopeptide (TPR) repeat protein
MMINFSVVASWLNKFDRSHLDETAKLLVDRFNSASFINADVDQSAKELQAAAEVSRDALSTAEVYVRVAEKLYGGSNFSSALTVLQKAIKIYEAQVKNAQTNSVLHKLGVAHWLAGWAGWGKQLHYPSYKYWWQAREDFEKALVNAEDEENGDKIAWYQESLEAWNVELVCRAEEVYTWLYVYPSEHMILRPKNKKNRSQDGDSSEQPSQGASQLEDLLLFQRNRIVDEIKGAEYAAAGLEYKQKGDFRLVRQYVQDMLDSLVLYADHEELAEAHLECGLALHQIRVNREACRLLRRAADYYMPNTHQQAVAWWMLGIMQSQPDGSDGDPMMSFSNARKQMIDLKTQAGPANNLELVDWYTKKLGFMEKAVQNMLQQRNSLL